MLKQEANDLVADIWNRRLDAFSAAAGLGLTTREHFERMEDATTTDDIDAVENVVDSLPKDLQRFIDLYAEIAKSYVGYRCSVCGRTKKQNEDIGYDCAWEC